MKANFLHLLKARALAMLCAASLPATSFAATDTALLPRNLSPWGMFVNADIVVKAVMMPSLKLMMLFLAAPSSVTSSCE